ncbi:hypothetical protein OIDMADRAFT_53095 [Oidiodendron maius Zn]|uniref:Integrase zinc-binding domain-containing protein n=1 Tax=Oidiodendron maius (strain Zn) TaxID=913774 RepID=A0A0C3DMQ3_OIDMZ|nr:hypothetical protein OIDMADRAFT_53095 [Oidiodendron maius Zn]
MATIASINPFPNNVRNAFQDYIHQPEYSNRARIPYANWRQMHIFLDTPDQKPENSTESNLKHRALIEFELISNRLYRQGDKKYPDPRYVVPESEAFDTIVNENLQLLHAGRDKVWAAIQQKYYGITCSEVTIVLKLCKNCALNRPAATKAPLQPIVSGRAWERVQVDLIDMRHEPSGQYKWILHIKDHFAARTICAYEDTAEPQKNTKGSKSAFMDNCNHCLRDDISKPAALRPIDILSSLAPLSSTDTIIPKDDAPLIGNAAKGSSLWRSILDTHGKEILERASHQFLDLATALRLQTITTRDLVGSPAKAGRLVDASDKDKQPSRSARSTSILPGARKGQGRSDYTASPHPSPVNIFREPKRQKIEMCGSLRISDPSRVKDHPPQPPPTSLEKPGSVNVKRRQADVVIQEQWFTSPTPRGKSEAGLGTKDGTVLQVVPASPRCRNVLKRLHAQRSTHAVSYQMRINPGGYLPSVSNWFCHQTRSRSPVKTTIFKSPPCQKKNYHTRARQDKEKGSRQGKKEIWQSYFTFYQSSF